MIFDLSDDLQLPLDLLVSNPPYVTREERDALAPEVKDFEPAQALFAPPGDPDHWLRRLIDEGRERLAQGGVLLVELGHRQSESAKRMARERGLELHVERDLDGVPRVAEFR